MLHEVLWFGIGVAGFLINMANVRDAQQDLDLLLLMGKNGWMKKIVTVQKNDNRDRMLVNFVIMLMGLLAMLSKPTVHNPHTSHTTLGLTVGFFIIVLVSVATPIRNRKLRHDFMLANSSGENA